MAMLGQAQIVGCTLSAAGGELASLVGNAMLFDGLIIDEVRWDGRSTCIAKNDPCWAVKLHGSWPHLR